MLITIDHKLRIALSELPEDALHSIEEALTIPNIERLKAMEQGIWGWKDMPPNIRLFEYDYESKDLVMPRGFLDSLIQECEEFWVPYVIQDNRFGEFVDDQWDKPIHLHPWQAPAVEAILRHRQGIWKAPAGSGKTVGVLEAIRRSRLPGIVLVNTKDIMYQWQDRAHAFLGDDFPVGLIGDGHFKISNYLTIATVQTLNSRFSELEDSYFFDDQFGFLCLDECHHATAATYRSIVDRFAALIRIGVSATPDKTGDFALATNVLGPIFHNTPPEDVDSLIEPSVFKISTNFDFKYRGAMGRRPSNYPELLEKLVTDEERNKLIVKTIMMNPGSHSLVVSKRLEHLDIISEMLYDSGYESDIYHLTGKHSSEARKMVIETITNKPGILLSTLADEALDIPRLDSIFLVFPQRNVGLIEQQVGRIRRSHPDKAYATVYDFADWKVGPLDAQWKVRRNLYMKNNYKITVVSTKEVMEYEFS